MAYVNKYSGFKYKYKYKYPSLKYEYKYKYWGLKYKYMYKYFKLVLEYNSSISTSTNLPSTTCLLGRCGRGSVELDTCEL